MKMVDLPQLRRIIGYSPYTWRQVYLKAKLGRASYRYWKGEREFPLEVALKISYFLEIPASEFLTADAMYLIRSTTSK